MVSSANAMLSILDEAFEWRMRATFGSTNSLSKDQLEYRKKFYDDSARLDKKFGLTWDKVFGGKAE